MDDARVERFVDLLTLHRLTCTYCRVGKVGRKSDACSPCRKWLRQYAALRPVDLLCANPGCANAATCTDHDHLTGSIRGDLCHACNKAEGLLGGDPARMRGLADYVEYWRDHPRSMAEAMEQRKILSGQLSLDELELHETSDDALF